MVQLIQQVLRWKVKTEVSFTTSQKMTLYVYYGLSGTNTNVKVDGVKQSGAPTTVVLEAGAHKITKGELYYSSSHQTCTCNRIMNVFYPMRERCIQ